MHTAPAHPTPHPLTNPSEAPPTHRPPEGPTSALTVLEDALHVEPVRGARLVVGAALEVRGEFARACVVNDARVTLADRVCGGRKAQVKDTVHNEASLRHIVGHVTQGGFHHIGPGFGIEVGEAKRNLVSVWL